jgi:GDPmannose 4,6-dehydratase
MSKPTLIFGISGQDGSYLSRLMLAEDYKVFGTLRDAEHSSYKILSAIGILELLTLLSASPADFRYPCGQDRRYS